MFHPITYIRGKITAHPIASALVCLVTGYAAKAVHDWYVSDPLNIGIESLNTNIGDRNGDGFNDIELKIKGKNHLFLGLGDGSYIGLKGLEEELRKGFNNAEASLNQVPVNPSSYIPTFRNPARQKNPSLTPVPTVRGPNPSIPNQAIPGATSPPNPNPNPNPQGYNSTPSSESYSQTQDKSAQDTSSGLENRFM